MNQQILKAREFHQWTAMMLHYLRANLTTSIQLLCDDECNKHLRVMDINNLSQPDRNQDKTPESPVHYDDGTVSTVIL